MSLTFIRKILQSDDTSERLKLLKLLQNIKKVVVDYHTTVTQRVYVLKVKYLNQKYAEKELERSGNKLSDN